MTDKLILMKKLLGLILLVSYSVHAQQNIDSATKADLQSAGQYLKGYMKPLDPQKAFGIYMQYAAKNNVHAMYAVATLYKNGVGVGANPLEAAKWYNKAAESGSARAWCDLGIMYKYGRGVGLDYAKAFECFSKAVELNEPSAWYLKGYMLYKGIGCTQDYNAAYALFKKGSYSGKLNSMFFYGLCLRNGYGTAVNKDSARFWLSKSAAGGYKYSADELLTKDPENTEVGGQLVDEIKAAQQHMAPTSSSNNHYIKVPHSIAASDVEGRYEGYLIKYDWSGQHIADASTLKISIKASNDTLNGFWLESDSIRVPLSAIMTPNALLFNNMRYLKTGHYNPNKPALYIFKNASLQLTKTDDAVYLGGNITMFDQFGGEPEKPLYVALVRTSKITGDSSKLIQFHNADGSLMEDGVVFKTYPNPFKNTFTVDFTLSQPCDVHTEIFTMEGKRVYENAGGRLSAGSYMLPVAVTLPAGTYIVRLYYGKLFKVAKVVKL